MNKGDSDCLPYFLPLLEFVVILNIYINITVLSIADYSASSVKAFSMCCRRLAYIACDRFKHAFGSFVTP